MPEKPITDYPCRKCGAKELTRYEDESSDYEDYRYTCKICGHRWWEEGVDS
jgi:predicted RNA-binding Zn-ribbon protein involved in translation (DUF1610 family)